MGTSLVDQWLGLCASKAGGVCSIPGWETKISHASWLSKKKKKEKKNYKKKTKLRDWGESGN